jgi:hypothetical protein
MRPVRVVGGMPIEHFDQRLGGDIDADQVLRCRRSDPEPRGAKLLRGRIIGLLLADRAARRSWRDIA